MDGAIRVFVTITTDLVNEAQKIHHTYPVATAALGRTLTAAAIIGAGLKNETDTTTIQFKGDGPLGSIVAVTDSASHVRGYVPFSFTGRKTSSGRSALPLSLPAVNTTGPVSVPPIVML